MQDAQRAERFSLEELVRRLGESGFVIPDFQRDFEWEPWDINALWRSIFLDYYIGSLLLWKGKDSSFEALACEPIYGIDPASRPQAEHIVLDGQQRLTAISYAVSAPDVPLPRRKNRYLYFLRVDALLNEEHEDAFYYTWLKDGTRLLEHPEEQHATHRFPLSVIGAGSWAIFQWVEQYDNYWKRRVHEAQGAEDEVALAAAEAGLAYVEPFKQRIRDVMQRYQVSYIELDREIGVDKVCDIFTQINSRGVQLDVFDLMNALLKPKGLQLKHMWRAAKPRLEFVDSTKLNVYILQVMSIMRQNYCSPKYLYYLIPGHEKKLRNPNRTEVLVPNVSEFETRWNTAVDALEGAIRTLRHPHEYGVVSPHYLPYTSILPVFAALQAYVDSRPQHQRLAAQNKVRHWYWASIFTKRYSGSVESTSAKDYLDVKRWIEESDVEPAPLLEFAQRFRNIELRKETKKGSSVYNGIFNLLVIRGAKDWIISRVPHYDEVDDHHIVPASWRDNLENSDEINSILNRTPLTADTNRNLIRDQLPNQYLPRMIEQSGEDLTREVLESHFISPRAFDILLKDPFTAEDFDEFLAERQRTLLDAIESLLIKERLDLEPQLQELDKGVETVELALRQLIQRRLTDDVGLLPSKLVESSDQRLQAYARKHPGLDFEQLRTLEGRLEFFDLRELEEVISNKTLWPRFADVIQSKPNLQIRLNQLAELRNSIRHTRTVRPVTRKDGEAALLWFHEALSQSEPPASEQAQD